MWRMRLGCDVNVPNFTAIEWFTVTFKGRPTRVATVCLDRERDEQALRALVGSVVLIDGARHVCVAVDRFTHMPPWRKDEMVGLAVVECAVTTPMTEPRAREILGPALRDSGVLSESIYSPFAYAHWEPGDAKAILDGGFTADELEAIAWWMRNAPLPKL